MKFSVIKSNINETLVNYFTNKKDNYRSFSVEFFKLLRENKDIKKLFKFYDDINSLEFKNDSVALHFINENKKGLNYKSKQTLVNLFKKWNIHLNENISVNVVDSNIDLLFESEDEQYFYSKDFLVEHLKKHKSKQDEIINENLNIPPSVMINLISEKFNQKYSDKLNETEKEILKSTIEGETKKIFESLKDKTLKLIDNKKSDFDNEMISEVENKLKGMVYNESTYIKDISKITELLNSI